VPPSVACFWWDKTALRPVCCERQLIYHALCPIGTPIDVVNFFFDQLHIAFKSCRFGSLHRSDGEWLHSFTISDSPCANDSQGFEAVMHRLKERASRQRKRWCQPTVIFIFRDCIEGSQLHAPKTASVSSSPLLASQGLSAIGFLSISMRQLFERQYFRTRLKRIAFAILMNFATLWSWHSILGECLPLSRQYRPIVQRLAFNPCKYLSPGDSLRFEARNGHTSVHCSYGFAAKQQMFFYCWVNSNGCVLDTACLPCAGKTSEACVQLIWEHSSSLLAEHFSDFATLELVFVKWGTLLDCELAAWEAVICHTSDTKTAKVARSRCKLLPLPAATSWARVSDQLADPGSVMSISVLSASIAPASINTLFFCKSSQLSSRSQRPAAHLLLRAAKSAAMLVHARLALKFDLRLHFQKSSAEVFDFSSVLKSIGAELNTLTGGTNPAFLWDRSKHYGIVHKLLNAGCHAKV